MKCGADLASDGSNLYNVQRTVPHAIPERLALQQLHHDVPVVLGFTHVVQSHLVVSMGLSGFELYLG